MTQVYIQTAKGPQPRANYAKSIVRPVAFAARRSAVPAGVLTDLTTRFPAGSAPMWGAMDGVGSRRTYSGMQVGDTVVFVNKERAEAAGIVALKWRSEQFARAVWGPASGPTWEHMWALDDLRTLNIPNSELHAVAGYETHYVSQGLTRVRDQEAARRILVVLDLGLPIQDEAATRASAADAVLGFQDELDAEATVKRRAEQAKLRGFLLGKVTQAACALCGDVYPSGLLIAAHIKPRAACSHDERTDFKNVLMLACALGCDELYERGFVAVDDRGVVRRAVPKKAAMAVTPALDAYLARLDGRTAGGFTPDRAKYYRWHRENRTVA